MDNKIQRCSERVSIDSWHFGQCSKKAVVERDGKFYCKIHDPVYVKAKRDKKQKIWDAGWEKKKKKHYRVSVMEEYFNGVSTEQIEQMIKDKKEKSNG